MNSLINYNLSEEINVVLSYEDNQYYLKSSHLKLYAYGKTKSKAYKMMQEQIEDLYEDLMKDDNFSPTYLGIKKYLSNIISAK